MYLLHSVIIDIWSLNIIANERLDENVLDLQKKNNIFVHLKGTLEPQKVIGAKVMSTYMDPWRGLRNNIMY